MVFSSFENYTLAKQKKLLQLCFGKLGIISNTEKWIQPCDVKLMTKATYTNAILQCEKVVFEVIDSGSFLTSI